MDEVSQIRERIDLPSFIQEYIPLKKMGRNFKANCPFHLEKTPSFVVSPERQIWHCFGCNKGGDVYTFLMEYEKLDFVEALRILAKRAGVPLAQSSFQIGVSNKKEKIYILNKLAMEFYHYVLTKHAIGKTPFSYLVNQRKIDKGLIETFMIGFAPRDGTSLSNYLINKKKHKREDLVEAGLGFYRDGQVLDFFRGRIIFPLFDHRNNVVGFSGRAIDDQSFGGKYINTRDTIVYHKGGMFFGLNSAKDEIKKSDKAIIVEGEFDVISCFGEGIKNVIAVKGTALTEDQVSLIARFTNNICLCFDKDQAGLEATKRSLPILEKKGINTTIVEIKNGKDADEAIKNDPLSFKNAIKKDIVIYDYLLSHTFSLFDKDTVDGKRKISSELLPVISRIENAIVKEHYLKKLSIELDTSIESLVKEMERIEKKESVKEDVFVIKKDKRTRQEILEEYLLSLIVQNNNPKIALERSLNILSNYEFRALSFKKIIDVLVLFFKGRSGFNGGDFSNSLPKELLVSFDTCYLFPLSKFEDSEKYLKEIERVSAELRAIYLKDKIKNISENLKKGEEKDDSKTQILEEELSRTISLLSQAQNVVK